MSAKIYYDKDADLSIIQSKRLAFIGYGNQGAAQSKNLRDSAVQEMVIGNREDEYKKATIADDFRVVSIPEAAAWGDKEPLEVFERIAEQGLFAQLTLHSHTSQYGQLRALQADDGSWLYERFRRVLEDDILSGRFTQEWSDVQAKGLERLEELRSQALGSSLGRAEASVRGENEDKS